MSWIFLAVLAHFLYAITFIADRVFLTKTFKKPIVYTFYSGLLNGSVLIFFLAPVLLPQVKTPWFEFSLNLYIPSDFDLAINFITGAFFLLALYLFYRALVKYDSSQMVPLVGSLIPLFSLFLAWRFLGETLSIQELIAFFFLVVGGIVISFKKNVFVSLRCFSFGLTAALAFAIFFVLSDYAYQTQPFFNSFVWIRVGTFIFSLILLLSPFLRKIIFTRSKAVQKKTTVSTALIGFRGISAIATFSLHFAINKTKVSLVNALQGSQYVFLIILVIIMAKKFPFLLLEEVKTRTLFQRIVAILLIGGGLMALAF